MTTIRTQRVSFVGSQGDMLDARLDSPEATPRAYALFAHCFTCSKNFIAASRISRALAKRGIAVLRFDFTGLGSSEGDFANTNFSSNVTDLVMAADYLREKFEAPQILIGHSLGGAAVLAAAAQIPESVAVATIGAPSEPTHVSKHFAEKVPQIEQQGEVEVNLSGRSFRIQRQFLEDIASHRMEGVIADLGRALLVFHSPGDDTVSIEHAQRIFQTAKHPRSFVSLDDADHLLTRREDAEYVAEVLASWATRYIPRPERAEAEDTEQGVVIVTETGEGKYIERIQSGRHRLLADEPESVGGNDAGPGPYELLLASLGSCTAMTLRMYADHKQLPLERVIVRLRHEKIHAKDCHDCETREGRIDVIEREIELEGDLDETQRARMLEIADRCPVHRTLHGEIKVETRFAD